jgi:hypothetical protein
MSRVILAIAVIAAILFHHRDTLGRGLDGSNLQQGQNEQLAGFMAPYVLRCSAQMQDSDAVAARIYAFVLLQMPSHALEVLRSNRSKLSSLDIALFEGAIARLESDGFVQDNDFYRDYLPLVQSPNSLLEAHLSRLRSVGGGGMVTNLSPGIEFNPKPIPSQAIMLVTISSNWMSETCTNGLYKQLANQLKLIAELRHLAPRWQVVLAISEQLDDGGAMKMQVLAGQDAGLKTTSQVFYPADPIFKGNNKESQRACESAILEALYELQ